MRITHDRRGAPPAPGATLLATTPGSGLYFATFEYLQQPGMYGKPFGFEGGGRGGGSGPPTPQSKGCPDRHPTSFASSKKSEIFLSVLCAKKCSKKSKKMSILDLCSKEKSRDSTFPAFFRTEIFSAPYHFEVEEVGVRPPPPRVGGPHPPLPAAVQRWQDPPGRPRLRLRLPAAAGGAGHSGGHAEGEPPDRDLTGDGLAEGAAGGGVGLGRGLCGLTLHPRATRPTKRFSQNPRSPAVQLEKSAEWKKVLPPPPGDVVQGGSG